MCVRFEICTGPVGERCNDGYQLNQNKTLCSDIDECSNGDASCEQLCENTMGSFRCSCLAGFLLSSDKVSCELNHNDTNMFYSSYDSIYRVHQHTSQLISMNGAKIVDIDVHFDKKQLYFTIEESDALYVINWNRNLNTINSVKNIGTPTRVAVDWITDNVYVIDDSRAINVCHMDAHYCIRLFECRKSERITSLAIDPLHRRLFYAARTRFHSNRAAESAVYAAYLDGSQRHPIIKYSFNIAAIACDHDSERLFYVGPARKEIWSVKYDGTENRLEIGGHGFLTKAIGIALIQNRAYVTKDGSNHIVECKLSGNKNCDALSLSADEPENLVIAHRSVQKSGKNVCAHNKCKTICTQSASGTAKCICDFGVMVEEGIACDSVVSV